MRDSKSKPESTEVAEATEIGMPPVSGLNRLTELIIGAAIEVHRNTGPGLMESVYEECLCYELSQLGLKFQRQVELPVSYKQIKLNCGFRMDLVVEDAVVLELKTVDQLLPIHSAQLLTYLKLSGKKIGLLINFNEPVLKRGLKRLATRTLEPSERLPSVLSATSVLSGFDFLKTLCLRASVVNQKRLATRTFEPSERLPSVLSAASVLSGFDFLNSPCLRASVVNQKRLATRTFEPSERPPSVFSAASVLSGFDFLKTLCLRASVVNKNRLATRTLEPSERLPSVFSATSLLSGFDFLKTLCLCASVVNK